MSHELSNQSDQYIAQLGIMWRVSMQFGDTDRPQIMTEPSLKQHQITLPESYRGRETDFRCDIAHELIHASYAEKIDPIFASVFFDPAMEQDPNFVDHAYDVYHAQQLIDVWVGDRMAELDKTLVFEDIDTFMRGVESASDSMLTHYGDEFYLMYAINHAQIQRTKQFAFNKREEQLKTRIRRIFSKPDRERMWKLADFFATLPKMPTNRSESIKIFDTLTKSAAELLGKEIVPSIVHNESDDRYLWQYTLK